MYYPKILLVVLFCVQGRFCVTSDGSQNDTATILWNLSNYALQSRQNPGGSLYAHYSNRYPNRIPSYAKPYPYRLIANGQYSQRPLYQPHRPPNYPYLQNQNYIPQRESVMGILHTVARNDDLECVPKIICEVTSGTMGSRQSPIGLPLNLNLESLLGLLSAWNGLQTSPILHFGKAALLGYTSKGNTRSCAYAYPECPSDPDRLVQYLNNHNGGFFRYFNGIQPSNTQGYAPQYYQYQQYPQHQQHPHQQQYPQYQQHPQHQQYPQYQQRPQHQQYPQYQQHQQFPHYNNPYVGKRAHAERRIQNKPDRYIPLNYVNEGSKISFPPANSFNNHDDYVRESKGLSFPTTNDHYSYSHSASKFLKFPNEHSDSYRKPKKFFNDQSYYHQHNEILDFQKPLPNHKATQSIFPDRTGTGELKLDPEELGFRDRPAYEDQNVVINVHPHAYNPGYRDYAYQRYQNGYSKGNQFNFPS